MSETEDIDPKGLIRESFRIEGITAADCRTIFLDWVLSLPEGRTQDAAIDRLLAHYAPEHPDHPMVAVLREAREAPRATGRRGGFRSRRP